MHVVEHRNTQKYKDWKLLSTSLVIAGDILPVRNLKGQLVYLQSIHTCLLGSESVTFLLL
jgi:hypothetical protein